MRNPTISRGLNILFGSEIAFIIASFFGQIGMTGNIIAAVLTLAALVANILALKKLSAEDSNYFAAWLLTIVDLAVCVVVGIMDAVKKIPGTGAMDVTSCVNLVVTYSVIAGTNNHLNNDKLRKLGGKAVILAGIAFIAITAVSNAFGSITGTEVTAATGITAVSAVAVAIISAGIGLAGDILYLIYLCQARKEF